MNVRRTCRIVPAGVMSALLTLGTLGIVSAQAGASTQKKHPKKQSIVKKLKALAKEVETGKSANYQAVYTVTYGGHAETITLARTSSKSLFKTTAGAVIDTGTQTLYCAATTCEEGVASNPVAPLEGLFSATTAHSFITQAEAEAAAKLAGYSVKFSTATYGGLKSVCATVNGHGISGKYCVSGKGILTYLGSSSGSFQLSSFASTIPVGDFAPPPNATIVTLPST